MRTKKTFLNIFTSFSNNVLLNILRFITRTIFIKQIGELYLGVNGLLTNVLGILALADLGIGTAVGYSLYEPLKDNNKEKIKSLMSFYKKSYYIIAIVVLIAGLILLPFLNIFVNPEDWIEGLKIYYLLFLANMVMGYLFAHKRVLITSDQNEYKINLLIMLFNFLISIAQIIVLLVFKNYILYLLAQTIVLLFENIFVNRYIDKCYPYIKEKEVKPLNKKEKKKLFGDIKALIYHKIGGYFVDSTDNLIISKFIGLVAVGLYSNYALIISILNKFINNIVWSVTASYGNLNVSESKEKKENVYNIINFIAFIIYGIGTVCLINLFNLFVGNIWLGNKYILSFTTIIIISINFYVSGMMHVNEAIKNATGLYTKDKYVPLIQSVINIVASIILVKYYGIAGVFLGTLISYILPTIIKPIVVYKYIFEKNSYIYFIIYLKEALIIATSTLLSYFILSKIVIYNNIIKFIIGALTCIIISTLLITIFYFKTEVFKDVLERIKKIIKRGKQNDKN